MTPRDKAIELFDAMGISISYLTNYTGGDDIPVYTNPYTKKCALIAVNEIIRNITSMNTDYETSWTYWTQVKAEIEKM